MARPVSEGADAILNNYYPVLDHGFVALVDYMGNDESIEHAARLSYGKGTRKRSQTETLLRYLKRHRHTTPSEMVELKFHVAMPIFVARQWVRHRTASINEYSGRYSELPDVFYTPAEWRFQSTSNRQGSSSDHVQGAVRKVVQGAHEAAVDMARDTYDCLLGSNVAKEIARIDMPVSGYTQWYWKMDLHNLMHFLGLRCDPHAQLEIRVYANIIAAMVQQGWPIMYQAWLDYQLEGVTLSRMERNLVATALVEGLTIDKITEDMMVNVGMSNREMAEFYNKLDVRKWTSDKSEPSGDHFLPAPLTFEDAFARLFPNTEMEDDS